MAPTGPRLFCEKNIKYYVLALTECPSSNVMTNEQKKDWFLRLDPNGVHPLPSLSSLDLI